MVASKKGGVALKNAWEKFCFAVVAVLLFAVVPCRALAAPDASEEWYWLASDAKYSKYFAPNEVTVVKSLNVAGLERAMPTVIQGWIKTSFSYEGAKETIANYGIKDILPDPAALAYSLALVEVSPQNRTFRYLEEDFYDAQGNILWSKRTPGSEKEMNSQQYDETFYAAIVDSVFGMGELERLTSSDRWYELWKEKRSDGGEESAMADTSTMRRTGDNLVFWAWTEVRDANGKVVEIKFDKRAVNLPQGTERIVTGRYWSPSDGWQPLDDGYEGAYRMIVREAPEGRGLIRLRAFADGYSTWVNRYQVR